VISTRTEGEDKGIIEPRRGRGEQPVSPGMIMGFTPLDLRVIRTGLGMEGKPSGKVDLADRWTCGDQHEGVGLAGPALGSPAAAMLMERLVALGARWIIGLGSCGSIQPQATIGRVILPTSALAEEGTSLHYSRAGVHTAPDEGLVNGLVSALDGQGIAPLLGRIWTTDAPFRETRGKVILYQKEGILGVDMEASALMTVASFRGISFASMLVVSDELGSLRWKRGFGNPGFLEGLAKAAGVAAGVLMERTRAEREKVTGGTAG
jgi:nucleoside phosphorylase